MGSFDIFIIIVYFGLLIIIGSIVSKQVHTNKDALAGGEGFGIFTAAVGRTANMAGGPATVGNTTYGYQSGLGGSWFAISNIIGMWVAAPFAPRMYRAMKRKDSITIGGYIGNRFGKFPKIFAGITNFLAYTGFVASNLLATGTVLRLILGWDFKTSMIITAVIVTIYTLSGGLKSVFQINIIQVAIMILGFAGILMPLSIKAVGGWSVLMSSIPDAFRDFGVMGWGTIIGTIIIPTALTGFTTQAGFIGIASSKNLDVTWKSTLLGGVFYIFIAIPVIFVGMSAFLLFPEANAQQILAISIVKILPTGLIGVLVASVISATMSTAASCALNAVTCFSKDVLEPLRGKKLDDKSGLRLTRILIVIISLIATLFAVLLPDVIELLLIGYSLAAGGLLVPVFATMFWKRATNSGIIAAMLGGGISYLILESVIKVSWPPLFLSIPLSLALVIIVSLMTEPQELEKYAPYFEDSWAKYTSATEK
ncbi:sodium:solute symporter family protein [Anaerosalibacter bizertensis]|uniref:Sodium:solute symporter family protein n=1 Tax=Anaerosalibacter bizertensis TaxID=932217 RepID=A0A844FJ37_9FIRM|nr:sodium:solute symporter family protein [Anaerosalibacter bizertensis]MSS44064.1 sodium:solute symporter family protein [Anaerosalibacter bizertensis]